MESDRTPFNNIIQLEEITHFQKPKTNSSIKKLNSILSTHRSKQPKLDDNGNNNKYPTIGSKTKSKSKPKKKVRYLENPLGSDKIPEFSDNHTDKNLTVEQPGTSKSSLKESSDPLENSQNLNQLPPETQIHEFIHTSDESGSESDTEFHRKFTKLPTGRDFDYFNQSNPNGNGNVSGNRAISDENLFPVGNAEVMQVTKVDAVFALIVLIINVGVVVADFTMAIWHYNDNLKWASACTWIFIVLGSIGMLRQFGLLLPDQLDRLFRKGKRVRILVNCFPPAATIITSIEASLTACRALGEPMQSQQYFKINDVSRSLQRVQSFFQSAPQAVLQLLVLIENYHSTTAEKEYFTFICIALSLALMTNANLPSKSDAIEDAHGEPSKAAYLPWTRLFVGLRMFSSIASRCMSLTYLLLGCRCLLNWPLTGGMPYDANHPENTKNTSLFHTSIQLPVEEPPNTSPTSVMFLSTLVGIGLAVFPRVIFTTSDYITAKKTFRRNLERYRDQPELGISSSHPRTRIPILDTFVGYLATIFFPVGDPLWLFWYLWCESGIFIIFGNVSGVTHSCLDDRLNGIYTLIFATLFIVIPCIIPYIKALVHRRKIQKFRRILQVAEDPVEPTKNDPDETEERDQNRINTNDFLSSRNVVVPC